MGQPHLHTIAGGLGENRIGCCYPLALDKKCSHVFNLDWARADCRVGCIEHELAGKWYDITGDSFVVNAKPVVSSRKAGGYLAKYIVKSVDSTGLAKLGFKKNWTRSRNWPGCDKLVLQVAEWDSTEFRYKRDAEVNRYEKEIEISEEHPLARKTGSPEAWESDAKAEKDRRYHQVKEITRAINW